MSVALNATIQNMCLFVLQDKASEVWMMVDVHHRPKLKLDASLMTLPDSIKHLSELDLTGSIVSIGSNGTVLGSGATVIAGADADLLINLEQITPGATLKAGWAVGVKDLPLGMACRLVLPKGTLFPKAQCTPGASREWTIGRIRQRLTGDNLFTVEGVNAPFIRVSYLQIPITLDIPLIPDGTGMYLVQLGAQDTAGYSTIECKEDVAFLMEFSGFLLALSLAKLPVPHAFWPDGCGQTDPDGGICPAALLDLRTP